MAEAIRRKMLSMGYDAAWIDDMGNVIGRMGTGRGPSLLFDGHIDTVGITDASSWSHDPYGGTVTAGKLVGRGSSDMKGSLAAMVCSVGYMAPLKAQMKGTIYVSGTVCEELVEGPGLGRVIEQVHPDYVVIGESSSLNLQIGQRGRGEVVIETLGKPAHSSTPHLGLNAVSKMAQIIPVLASMPMPEDELLGLAVLEVTDIVSRPYPGMSVVPDLCKATFDRRLLVGETPESLLTDIRALLAEHAQSDPQFTARVSIADADFPSYTGFQIKAPKFARAWKTLRDHSLVHIALKGLHEAGLKPQIGAYAFCTNGSYSAGDYGIPTVGFGPANEGQAHTIDEFITIDALLKGAEGYYCIARVAAQI